MAKQSKPQKETVARVMNEFKHGELRIRGTGPKVKNPKQAIAIALHEAGATNQESPAKNKKTLSRTKAKERKGETAQAEKEGKKAQDRTMKGATARKGSSKGSGTKASAKKSASKSSGASKKAAASKNSSPSKKPESSKKRGTG
jgi:hypothetical protein